MITSLIGNSDAFPVLRQWAFFNHAGVSPLPRAAADAMRRFAVEAETTAYVDTDWYRDVERFRAEAADFIGASAGEVAFVKNTSEGLATVAGGIDWRAGDRIVTSGVEYPANIYPWMDLARRMGVELVMVPESIGPDGALRVPMDEILTAASHSRTRMVSLSHVEFASGQRHDLSAIGRWCRENGRLFCVDAIQSLGVLPVDVRAMNIDYLSADGHKWLLGPEGAGIFYCRRELLNQTRPVLVGWMNVAKAEDFSSYDFTLKPDARKFECGSWNVPGLLALRASMAMLREAGVEAIAARIKLITDRLIEGLRAKGYETMSPRAGDQWSGIVSFTKAGLDLNQLWRTLRKDYKIELALRGGRLRCSPHFYNTENQIDRLSAVLP